MPIAGHGLRALIEQARSSLEEEPQIAIETNSMYLQKQFVLAGHGWTVLPAAGVAGDVGGGRLSGAPLTNPELRRSVVLGMQRGKRTSPAVAAVSSQLIELVGELVRSGAWPSATLSPESPTRRG
jgi:DNA-binding transcriptional LysR family regulator